MSRSNVAVLGAAMLMRLRLGPPRWVVGLGGDRAGVVGGVWERTAGWP